MVVTAPLSRWTNKRRVRENGHPEAFVYNQNDLATCKLFAAGAPARAPWGYHYLPTRYVPVLLQRSHKYVTQRLRKLTWPPGYLKKPEQPRSNYRDIIYSLGKAGADQLREAGISLPHYRSRRLPHELMACMFAASFDIATFAHSITIVPNSMQPLTDVKPDWPVFQIGTPHHTVDVFLEADTGSEAYTYKNDSTNRIDGKYEQYLRRIADGTLKRPMILFATTRNTRVLSMIEHLRAVIDAKHFDHDHARHFGFTTITFDRFLNKIPEPTAWAVTGDWLRADANSPFNFLKQETW